MKNIILNFFILLKNKWIFRLKNQGLTYLSVESLDEIGKTLKIIEANKVQGLFIEAGCALGGSAILIAQLKKPNRRFNVYDVFGMIPSPSNKDGNDVIERYDVIQQGKSIGINGQTYYGYRNNLMEEVKANFLNFNLPLEPNNIHLIQGLYEDSLVIREPVAFAHIDCDWYASVMVCLTRIVPHLVKDGVIIIDDYQTWSGCKTAVDEYFAPLEGYKKVIKSEKLHIIKL
jgi:asparagine synthase (glutamine-hydrolysing)